LFEMDGNLRSGFGEAFAHTHIDWHIGPAPVVDEEAQCDERFRLRIRFYVLLLAITDYRIAVDRAFGVLAAHNVGRYLIAWQSAERSHHFYFFVANAIRAEIGGWFHCHKAKELEQVILHHVA